MRRKKTTEKKKKPYSYKPLLISAARKIWLWSPMRRQAVYNSRVSGKPGKVSCKTCGKVMEERPDGKKEYQIDHIKPARNPLQTNHTWDEFFERLFCPASGLSVLCKGCHDEKTKKENLERRNSGAAGKASRAKRTFRLGYRKESASKRRRRTSAP